MKRVVTAAEFYRDLSKSYDLAVQQGMFSDPETIYKAISPHITPGMKDVLDVGIGSGMSSAPFHRIGMEVTGIDSSREMLALCHRKNIAKSLICHDFETAALGVQDNSYDITLSHATLYMVANADFVMEDMIRATRPGGLVALNYEPSDVPTMRENDAFSGAGRSPQVIRTYGLPSDDVADLFKTHGMERLHAHTAPAYQKYDGSVVRFETLVYRKPFSL